MGYAYCDYPETTDLNECRIRVEHDSEPLTDHGGWLAQDIHVHFRNIKHELIKLIDSSDYVFGCVAWLTEPDILAALAKKRGVMLVVQKEDFLRPDIGQNASVSSKRLRRLYDALPQLHRLEFRGTIVEAMNLHSLGGGDAVRCVGNVNTEASPSHPRMHNKFVVFGSYEETQDHADALDDENNWRLTGVWTGSFNFTKTAHLSFENAVVISDKQVVKAYYEEFIQILALSEPLDWEYPWMAPEWRIGS